MSSTFDLWLKALHVIGVVCWFAGLFYLPRLFVYHSTTGDSAGRQRFCTMEDKLYRIIMRPSMLLTLITGIWMLITGWESFAPTVWLWVKLAGVFILLGYHHYCGRLVRAFASERKPHTERFFRLFNELPALLLIVIVIMVVVKPF